MGRLPGPSPALRQVVTRSGEGALRAVLFDLDDTLADSTRVERAVWPSVAELIRSRHPKVDLERLRERYLRVDGVHYPRLAAGEIDFPTFRRFRLADALEPWGELDDDLFERYMRAKQRAVDELVIVPGALETLRALRALGLRLGIITNGPSGLQRHKLRLLALEREVEAVAISEEIGAAKPDPAAYAAALELLGCAPGEAAMVGDSLENDVLGALGAGLAIAVWVRPVDGEIPAGALAVQEITQVPAALGLARR